MQRVSCDSANAIARTVFLPAQSKPPTRFMFTSVDTSRVAIHRDGERMPSHEMGSGKMAAVPFGGAGHVSNRATDGQDA